MILKMKYFAAIREACDKSEETLDTISSNGDELYEELKLRYKISIPKDSLKIAINEEYSSFETTFKENDIVALIPPVAGG